MFENAGKKIKKVAAGYFVVALIVGIVVGIVLSIVGLDRYDGDTLIWVGACMTIGAPILAWLSALLMYGFGEIVDTAILNRNPQSVGVDVPTIDSSKPVNWCCPRCGKPLTMSEENDSILCCPQCQNRYVIERKGLSRRLLKV